MADIEANYMLMKRYFEDVKKDVNKALNGINKVEGMTISCEPENGWEFFLMVKVNGFNYRVGVGPGYSMGRFSPKYKFQTYNEYGELKWKTYSIRSNLEAELFTEFLTASHRNNL